MICLSLVEHMGDIVAAEPIIRRLREEYPDAFLVWCIGKPYRELADSHPEVDMALPVRCLTGWILLRSLGLFDRVVDLHLPNRICGTCQVPLTKNSGNLQISASNYYSYGNLLNVMAQNAGIVVVDEAPRIYIPDEACRNVDRYTLPKRFVAIHCAANEDSRNWDVLKWRELVGRIGDEFGVDVVEVGLNSELPGFDSRNYRNLCGQLTILETAEVIRRAQLFVGIDSGPGHTANAVGSYGVILMGQYRDFLRYMPYSGLYETGENAEVIHYAGPARDIPVNLVFDAVARKLHAEPHKGERE